MPRIRVPMYRLHKPTHQAVTTIDGKDYYLGRHNTATSRAAYNELVSRWLAGGTRPGLEVSVVTVAEITVQYWRFAERYYSKADKLNTEAANIKAARGTWRKRGSLRERAR